MSTENEDRTAELLLTGDTHHDLGSLMAPNSRESVVRYYYETLREAEAAEQLGSVGSFGEGRVLLLHTEEEPMPERRHSSVRASSPHPLHHLHPNGRHDGPRNGPVARRRRPR